MKFYKLTIVILVIFFKTGNLLSKNNLFNVNNILLEKKQNTSNNQLANEAIKLAFSKLSKKVLLQDDVDKVLDLNLEEIKELVEYYNISKEVENDKNKISFNVTFDKEKIHNLFFEKNILYSDIPDKEFFILPIFLDEDNVFVFSNNFFYENWNSVKTDDLIEFILPIENIEIIQSINQSKNNLLELKLDLFFQEFSNKNVGVVLIKNDETIIKKIFIKARIQDEVISKSLNINMKVENISNNEEVIMQVKDEITNLIKSQNLIDIRTPSFLNARLDLDKKNNLAILRSKLENMDLIENIFVQEFNKDYVYIKIKYLGKLEKIIKQLKINNINLRLKNDIWIIQTL